jgi:hypothetical protein
MPRLILPCPECGEQAAFRATIDEERNHGYRATTDQTLCTECQTPYGGQVMVSHP